MHPQEFLTDLERLLEKFETIPVTERSISADRGNQTTWPEVPGTKRTCKVKVGDQWIAISYYLAKSTDSTGKEQAFLLVSAPASNVESVKIGMRLLLRSESTADGNILAGNPAVNADVRAAVNTALQGLSVDLPRFDKSKLLVGAFDDQFFGRLVLAVRELDAGRAQKGGASPEEEPPRYWAGGKDWDGDNMTEEFVSGNYWELGWKETDTRPAAKRSWRLFPQIRVGDLLAIKGYGGQNVLRIYYVGRVLAVDTETGVINLERVDVPLFHGDAPKVGQGGSWFGSLTEVRSEEAIAAIFGIQRGANSAVSAPARVWDEMPPLNSIHYGPPGTGKTYRSISKAVEIIDGELSPDRSKVQRRFRQLCDEERISFVTFHQSYGYEDFVEGIRPVLRAEEQGNARYELGVGVFKRIAIEALFDCLEPVSATLGADFDARWRTLVEQIEDDPNRTYAGLTNATEFRLLLAPSGLIKGVNVKSDTGTEFICPKHYMDPVFAAYPEATRINTTDVANALDHGSHTSFIAAVFRILKELEVRVPEKREVKSFEEKTEIVQRYLKRSAESGYQLKPEDEWRPYVLLIDEINRGNISKIFGELITLLEPDKRLGAPVEISLTLPYSKERFVVPQNLFVLGTMNTADKSLALLDLALRRRFQFEELQPDFSEVTCKQLPAKARTILQRLNHLIALRKDRDHLIGHAYFCAVTDEESFNEVFQRQVIPLLQEYFYNDWEGLRAVLGEDQSKSETGFVRPLQAEVASWARPRWQWFHDSGSELDCHETLLANFKLNGFSAAPAND